MTTIRIPSRRFIVLNLYPVQQVLGLAYIDSYFFDGFKNPKMTLLGTFLRDLIAPTFLDTLNEGMID